MSTKLEKVWADRSADEKRRMCTVTGIEVAGGSHKLDEACPGHDHNAGTYVITGYRDGGKRFPTTPGDGAASGVPSASRDVARSGDGPAQGGAATEPRVGETPTKWRGRDGVVRGFAYRNGR